MRITRRTSGGRGEYEVSEDHAGLTPTDLVDRRLEIVFSDGWVVDTGIIVTPQGGKRRLRMEDDAEIHLHRQVAASLLMPASVRADDALGSGRPVLKSDRYAIEHIELSDLEMIGGDRARIEIGEIILRNYNLHAELLQYHERVAQVRRLWEHAEDLPPEIGNLLQEHADVVRGGGPIPRRAEQLVNALQENLTEMGSDFGIFRQGGEDVVVDLLRTLELEEVPPEPPIDVEDVDPQEVELRRRTVREWKRWAAVRGAASARFRRKVREAYDWTCVVTGVRYPRTGFNAVAGVDAAHILPWADFDLDEVSNGLCLSKQAHWAFDEGLIVIRYDEESDVYRVEIPPEVEEGLEGTAVLEVLREWAGPIPRERLPDKREDWPRPEYLEALYELYHGG